MQDINQENSGSSQESRFQAQFFLLCGNLRLFVLQLTCTNLRSFFKMFYSIFAKMMFEQIARKANRLINIKLQRRKKINVNCAVKSIFNFSLQFSPRKQFSPRNGKTFAPNGCFRWKLDILLITRFIDSTFIDVISDIYDIQTIRH